MTEYFIEFEGDEEIFEELVETTEKAIKEGEA